MQQGQGSATAVVGNVLSGILLPGLEVVVLPGGDAGVIKSKRTSRPVMIYSSLII